MEKYLQIKEQLIQVLNYNLNETDSEYDRLKEGDCLCSLPHLECKCEEIFNNESNFKIILGTNISYKLAESYLNYFGTGEEKKFFHLIRDYIVEVNGKKVMENLQLDLSFSLYDLDDEETEVLLEFLSTITLEKGVVPKEKLEEIADNCINHLINSF
jgi:hypothetical protein